MTESTESTPTPKPADATPKVADVTTETTPAYEPAPEPTTEEPEVDEQGVEDYAGTMEVDEEMGSTST